MNHPGDNINTLWMLLWCQERIIEVHAEADKRENCSKIWQAWKVEAKRNRLLAELNKPQQFWTISLWIVINLYSLTRWPVDCLNWHPRFVSVDFIRMQNDRSKPLYLLFDWIDIDDDTVRNFRLVCIAKCAVKSSLLPSGFIVPCVVPSSDEEGDAMPCECPVSESPNCSATSAWSPWWT